MKRLWNVLLVLLIFVCSDAFASQVTQVGPEDCQLVNVGNMQLDNVMSVNECVPRIGKVLAFAPGVPSDAFIPQHTICEKGSIWIGAIQAGNNMNSHEKLVRIIWTDPIVTTLTGIHIGDAINNVVNTYGEPYYKENSLPEYNGIVDTWVQYFPARGKLAHLFFGAYKGKVTAIGVSSCSGGL